MITLRNASARTLKDVSFTIRRGEKWTILGPQGSGKSTLLSAIHGTVPSTGISRSVSLGLLSDVRANSAYYSERYHSRKEGPLLRNVLKYDDGVVDELGLRRFMDEQIVTLSNGQLKRAQIAALVQSGKEVLLLDEPFTGLDTLSRSKMVEFFREKESVVAVRSVLEVPRYTTHVCWLRDGTVKYVGEVDPIRSQLRPVEKSAQKVVERETGGTIVQLNNVTVKYYDNTVLHNVSWSIREHEKWVLQGSNGSGKTTLLALILGDHPKVFANDVLVFGKRVGPEMSLFALQREIGHTSPEIHRHFPNLTARRCVESSFSDSFLPSTITTEQKTLVDEIIRAFNVENDSHVPFRELSPSKQRLFLLLRAMAKQPRLLILDEPFAGLDESQVEMAKRYIDEYSGTVIFVSHHDDEVPASCTRVLKLDQGRVISP